MQLLMTMTAWRDRLRRCLVPRFGRDRSGTAAIQFALLAVPFFVFLLLILEVGLVLLVGQVLENVTQEAARMIRTGQAQQFTRQSFTAAICDRLWFPNCTDMLKLDVRVASDFSAVDLSTPIRDGVLDDRGFDFNAGRGDDIVVVRAYFAWPVTPALPGLIQLLGLRPQLPPTGDYLLLSTAVFRNEPFS